MGKGRWQERDAVRQRAQARKDCSYLDFVGEWNRKQDAHHVRAWWVAAATMAASSLLPVQVLHRRAARALEAEFAVAGSTSGGQYEPDNLRAHGTLRGCAEERFGIRRVVAAALVMVSLGAGLTW